MMLFFTGRSKIEKIENKIGSGAIRHSDGRDMRSDCKVKNITKNQRSYSMRHK